VGQVLFVCGWFAGGADVGVDGCDCWRECVRDVLVFVDDDLGEQGMVEDPAFCWLAFGVEAPEVGEQVSDLVEALACVGVGGGQTGEPTLDGGEARVDAVLLGLE
jgi:hypothetical protein